MTYVTFHSLYGHHKIIPGIVEAQGHLINRASSMEQESHGLRKKAIFSTCRSEASIRAVGSKINGRSERLLIHFVICDICYIS